MGGAIELATAFHMMAQSLHEAGGNPREIVIQPLRVGRRTVLVVQHTNNMEDRDDTVTNT